MRCLSMLPALVAFAAPAAADERRFMLTDFDRIRVEGPFAVEVTTGGSAGVVADGSGRALDSVSVRTSGTTLVIAPNINRWGGDPNARDEVPRLRVAARAVRGVAVMGGATVTVDRMRGDRVELSLTGAGALGVAAVEATRLEAMLVGTGALTVAGRAQQARFQSSGAGTVEAEGLAVDTLTVNTQGAGDASFSARTTAAIVATGRGAVRVAGAPACTITGSAPVTCGALPAR